MPATYESYVRSMSTDDLRTVLDAINGYARRTADDVAARVIIRRELTRRGLRGANR